MRSWTNGGLTRRNSDIEIGGWDAHENPNEVLGKPRLILLDNEIEIVKDNFPYSEYQSKLTHRFSDE
jgi:hypothetical protein